MSNWVTSPLTKISYDIDHADYLVDITTESSVRRNILRQFRNRIKHVVLKDVGGNEDRIVPVYFYHQNDRIEPENLKNVPFIIIRPMYGKPDPNQVQVDQVVEPVTADNISQEDIDAGYQIGDHYVNDNPLMYEYVFNVTVVGDDYSLYTHLCTCVKEQIFPRIYGTRSIVISIDPIKGPHKRRLEMLDENEDVDFENNYFQFDLSFLFDIPLLVNAWRTEYGISSFNTPVTSPDPLSNEPL